MRLLVTGKNGQITRALADLHGHQDVKVFALGRPDLDITNEQSVAKAIDHIKPDLVVNAAAFTAVDQAEQEQELAFLVNCEGARNVGQATASANIPLIHISTDYVFSGDKSEPYTETDATGPASIYGQSKLAGERAVIATNPQHMILRTAWIYSLYGKNFVKTMLRLADDHGEISVVADQIGNPTSARDIAFAIVHAAKIVGGETVDWTGTYHLCGTGSTSWAGFARHIFAISARVGGPSACVIEIDTSQFPTPAKRPVNSCLSSELFVRKYSLRMPEWRRSVMGVVEEILTQ